MIDEMVRKRVCKFNDGRTNLLNKEQRGAAFLLSNQIKIFIGRSIYTYTIGFVKQTITLSIHI